MFFYGEVFQVPDLQSGFSLFLTILESKSTKKIWVQKYLFLNLEYPFTFLGLLGSLKFT